MKRLLLFGAVVTFASIVAAEPPPRQPVQALDWPSSLEREPTKGMTLGAFRVQFEATTLSEVQRVASAGAIAQRGDAGDHILWLCYTAFAPDGVERIWIISHGEMGGDTHVVTAVTAHRLTSAAPSPDCPSLPSTLLPASLDAGIWLGSPDGDLRRILGPSHNVAGWKAYRYQGKVPGMCDGGFDMTNWLATKSEKGHVTAVYAGQVTSC